MAERQAAEPAVVGLDADVEARADRAPEVVAVGEADRVGGAGAAAGQDPAVDVVHVVLAEQRQVGLGLGQLAGVAEVDRRLLGGEHRGALLGGEPRAERQQDRPHLHQGVEQHHLLAARVHGQRRHRAAPHAVGGEAAGDPGRLRLQLGVGDLGAVGDQRGAVGAALGSLGEPVVEFHRMWALTGCRWLSCASCRNATRTPRPSRTSTRRSSGSSAGSYDDIRYEKADGIAKITIDRPEVRNAFRPQTLVEISAALELAREDTEVGVIVLTGEGREGLLLRRRPAVRGDTGYVATRGRAAGSAASTSPTCRCRCGGCRSRWSRWSPATRSAAATSSTSAAT